MKEAFQLVAKVIKMNKIMHFGDYYIGFDPKITLNTIHVLIY